MQQTDYLPLLVPIVAGVVGAVGILSRDLYNRRSEMGRRQYAMDYATRQVTFAAEWWKAKQALGCTLDDQAARTYAESWLEKATSLVSEQAVHPARRPEPNRSVTRRILLAYPFQRWTAKLLRVAFYLMLAIMVSGAVIPVIELFFKARVHLGHVLSHSMSALIFYGLLAFAVRAWAVSIESRATKQRTPAQPVLPTSGPTAAQPGWYPDPSGVPGQRYWDGQQWSAVAPGPTSRRIILQSAS